MNLLNEKLNPLQKLIAAYAKPEDRQKYSFLFAFDSRLADILKGSSEILIAQMKLTWWRDILTMPMEDRPSGEPLVAEINAMEASGRQLDPLLSMVDGWECVLQDFPWEDREFESYAAGRGVGFFEYATGLDSALTAEQKLLAQSWAYWDFARHCSDDEMRATAFRKCSDIMQSAGKIDFDRSGRPLAILCHLVASDVKKGAISADLYRPKSAAKIIWHGLTGV